MGSRTIRLIKPLGSGPGRKGSRPKTLNDTRSSVAFRGRTGLPARSTVGTAAVAPELGIRWCHDDTNFIHEIRADECLRKDTGVVSPLVDGNAVSCRHRKASWRSGNIRSDDSRHRLNQIGHIAAGQWKVT